MTQFQRGIFVVKVNGCICLKIAMTFKEPQVKSVKNGQDR